MFERLSGVVIAFIGCILVFLVSSKAKDDKTLIASLIVGSIAIGAGLKLIINV